ncbi:MAG: 30S ribosomal protein S17 [Candidatus Moranbacteria bacterium CG23_combo_of_CG06-09_8_20_14_all_39_10]|nr:MAG: 30S ribosomal protein S17 [Candidatus Moranbacteria bacterium CG23_combo_of_CG06-09_8_20_14_all_39_10]
MEKNLEQSKIIIKKKGVVVSDKMAKTVVVAVDSFKTHPKYKKKYKSTKKYKAHDEEGKYKVGDLVEIIPCRPMSKDKCYKVV